MQVARWTRGKGSSVQNGTFSNPLVTVLVILAALTVLQVSQAVATQDLSSIDKVQLWLAELGVHGSRAFGGASQAATRRDEATASATSTGICRVALCCS